MGLFVKKNSLSQQIKTLADAGKLPRHVAIIMDGNGRWAEARGLPRTAGHVQGSENFDRIASLCSKLGLEYLTVYAFSTENWKREEAEVRAIFDLFRKYLAKSVREMNERNVRLKILGDTAPFPSDIKDLIRETEEKNAFSDGMQVNVCINYGGRDEIVHAFRDVARDIRDGKLSPDEISPDTVSSHLYTAGIPDPDLLIRTGGDLRVSNFLLWQIAYSEIYVTDTLWPAFSEDELFQALVSFAGRDRRFGGYSAGKRK